MGSGACICFVDECEFKMAVLGQRRLVKNPAPIGFVLEASCAEIMQEYY